MTRNTDESALIEILRRGRVTLPEAVDERLGARVRDLAGASESAAAKGSRWHVFALAAGLAVVAFVGWSLRSPAASIIRPAQDPVRPAPQIVAEEPAKPARRAEVRRGARIALWSTVVAVVERGEGEAAATLEVLRWIKRPENLEAEQLELVAGDGNEGGGFLDRMPCAAGQPMLVELRLVADPGPAGGAVRVAPVHTVELHGLPTLEQGYGTGEYQTPQQALLAEVLRATESPQPHARRIAAAALFGWMGNVSTTEIIPPKSLWEGVADAEPGLASVPARMLQLALDRDPAIREQAAAQIPPEAGPAGRRTLLRLAFDREPAVRRLALESLEVLGKDDWLQDAKAVGDSFWEEMTGSTTWPAWRRRCVTAAAKEGITDPLGIWQRQLHNPRAENHLIGALALGTIGLEEAVEDLFELREVRDPRVRAAAAASRIALGDDRAWRDLEAQVQSGETRAAIFALDRLRRIETLRALDMVDETADQAAAPIVRAHAAGALRDLRSLARHRVEARLSDLRKDPHPMVRAAAGAQ